MTWYEFWLFVHILASMVWIGAATAIQVFGILTKRAADPAKTAFFAQNVSFTASRVRAVTLGEGAKLFDWDGRDARGRGLPPGLYFVRYDGAAGRSTVKVMKLEAGASRGANP